MDDIVASTADRQTSLEVKVRRGWHPVRHPISHVERQGRPLDPKRTHEITLEDGAAQTRRHRQGGAFRAGDSGAFNAAAVLELLQQAGCVGLRYYKGRNSNGEDTIVLVGVNAQGGDLLGKILNTIFPCPPFCPDRNKLNG